MKSARSRLWLGVALATAVLGGGTGCGLLMTLTGPSPVHTSQKVTYDLTVTNPSVCPVGNVEALFVPFVSSADLFISGDTEIEVILRALINASCTGAPINLPGGITCQIIGNTIMCTIPVAETTPGLNGDAVLKSDQETLFSCHFSGSTMTCTIPALEGASMPPPPPMLMCAPFSGQAQICQLSLLGPGQSATAQFMAIAPPQNGTFNTLVFGGATQRGICLNSSSPCAENSDCTMSTCGSGICVNNSTQALGHGCDNTSDCPMTDSCVECQPDTGPTILPLACAQTIVIQGAPAVSHVGTGAAVVALLALGFFGLAGLRRRA